MASDLWPLRRRRHTVLGQTVGIVSGVSVLGFLIQLMLAILIGTVMVMVWLLLAVCRGVKWWIRTRPERQEARERKWQAREQERLAREAQAAEAARLAQLLPTERLLWEQRNEPAPLLPTEQQSAEQRR